MSIVWLVYRYRRGHDALEAIFETEAMAKAYLMEKCGGAWRDGGEVISMEVIRQQ